MVLMSASEEIITLFMTLDLYGLEKAGLALIKPFLINI
jgi:hypothetical protein